MSGGSRVASVSPVHTASKGTVTIDDVDRTISGDVAELSARIRVEGDHAPGPALPERVFARVARARADDLNPTADPFVPAAWLLAAHRGLDVVVPSGVSARLSEGLPIAGMLYADWSERTIGRRYRPPALHASMVVRARSGSGAAAFFSGGVDSMFTLAHNRRRYPSIDSRSIKGVILVHGLDIPLHMSERFQRTSAVLQQTADSIHVPLIPVTTNIRDLLPDIDWYTFGHGPSLAFSALSLSGGFHTIYVPSTNAYTQLAPTGTHPALDPHWSTEGMEFVHDGAEFGRTNKIIALAAWQPLLAGLRVCWKNVADEYNCGRCEKCLRTMLTLSLHGLLPQATQFPAFDRAAYDDLRLSPATRLFWEDIQQWSDGPHADPGLRKIVADVLARPPLVEKTPLPEHGAVTWLASVAERTGKTPKAVIAIFDRWLFGGRLRQAVWASHTRARERERNGR